MTTLYLHVGSNKTATTTIQYQLAFSESVLARAGFYYPRVGRTKIGAHHFLAGQLCKSGPPEFLEEDSAGFLLEELRTELEANPADKVIISSEMLLHHQQLIPERFDRLAAYFDQVKVIVYLRRQDLFLPSFYSSRVNNNDALADFATFCRQQNLFNHSNLSAWADRVGREHLIARPFARAYWRNGNVVDDFLQQLGSPLTADELTASESLNESLPLEVIETLLSIGGGGQVNNPTQFKRFLTEEYGRLRGSSVRATLMTEEIYNMLRERYADENRRIALEFFGPGEEAALAFEEEYQPPGTLYEPLKTAELAAALNTLWGRQVRLRQRLREADAVRIARTEALREQRDELARLLEKVRGERDRARAELRRRQEAPLIKRLLAALRGGESW